MRVASARCRLLGTTAATVTLGLACIEPLPVNAPGSGVWGAAPAAFVDRAIPGACSSDRNLLFGILALQMDFVSREELLAGMQAWALAKEQPLAEHLAVAGALQAAHRQLLEPLVDAHLRQHGDDDVQHRLAALRTAGKLPEQLARSSGEQVLARRGQVAVAGQADEANLRTLSVPASDIKAGSRFRILRPHAQGGLGRVLVAQDAELNREVALKEIRPEYADNLESRVRFTQEAEITGSLEHPGIVPIYSLGTYPDGSPFYAMRFIRGKSFQEAIEKFHDRAEGGCSKLCSAEGNLQLRRLLTRLIDVCQAIHYAHCRGILHRDLKPSNIMLGKYGETLVVDWGLAKTLGVAESHPQHGAGESTISPVSLPEAPIVPSSEPGSTPTRMGTVVGTPAFMSPEQAQGRLDLMGPASDVFSLGGILYEILTGQPPYSGEDVLRKARNADYARPRQLNRKVAKPLEAICLKALAADAQDRYGSAGEFAEDLDRYLADEPAWAYSESVVEKLSRFARRHRAWTQAGFVALALTASVATIATFSIQQSLERAEAAELFAVKNFNLVKAAHVREQLRAEAEAEQRKRAEAAEEAARVAHDRAERDNQVVELLIMEYAPELLKQVPEFLDVDRELLGDFAVALLVARQADPTALARNRAAIATFARLLPQVFCNVNEDAANDDYTLEHIVAPALNIPLPEELTAEDQDNLAALRAANACLLERAARRASKDSGN
jgi:eukaryotic-like serine/threonine-protein kinase